MIHYVSGDLLQSRARVIAHGIAPGDHFDSGLALALRGRWPAMAKEFRHHCQVAHPRPGELWTWLAPDGRKIVNLLTQDPAPAHHAKPGPATLAHVNHVLRELHRQAEHDRYESLALPRLATGVGGLDWKDVRPLIERHLGTLSLPIFVYERFEPGVTADEPSER